MQAAIDHNMDLNIAKEATYIAYDIAESDLVTLAYERQKTNTFRLLNIFFTADEAHSILNLQRNQVLTLF